MDDANAGVPAQIDSFAANTLEFLRRERDLLTNGVDLPSLATGMKDRHVLVVVRGYRYREDLRALRPYIREYRPVLLAVDGGADALLEAGYRPDVIIGDMDSVSDEALMSGAELVVHAYPDGRAPGMTRLSGLGLDGVPLPAPGTSEDVALLVADACGASLIAVVGTHWTLEEFLDKGRPGMASTFLTHLRVGSKLVNARGVHQLYQSRISGWALAALVVAAAVTDRRGDRLLARRADPRQLPQRHLAHVRLLVHGTVQVIDFRYHLVSIVAVFLALAIGIVLGSTELQGTHPGRCCARSNDSLKNQLNAAEAQRTGYCAAGGRERRVPARRPSPSCSTARSPATGGHRHRAGRAVGGGGRRQAGRDAVRRHRHRHGRAAAEVQRPVRGHPGQPGRDQRAARDERRRHAHPGAAAADQLPAEGGAADRAPRS